MRRGLAAAAAGAAIALSCAPLFSAPADAQGAVTLSASPISMTPAPPNVGSNNLAVTGHFHVDGGFQSNIDWVSVNLTWRGPAPGPQVPGPFTMCGAPPSGTPPNAGACTNDYDFKDRPLAPPPMYNGPYRINATGHASDQISGGQDTKTTNAIDFNLVAPPPPVNAVTATVNKDRTVSVSWDRDAATPDVHSYWVYRKGPGDAAFKPVVQTPQLTAGARVTVGDSATQYKGGDYLYQIETRRNGASGDASSFVASDHSKPQSQSNKVTVGDPPPGVTAPPSTAPKGGGPPPVVRGTPSGVNRNSGFSGSGSSAATTPTSEAVTPDPGFVRGLPDSGGATPDDQSGEGDNSAVAVTPGRHGTPGRGYLIPVAGAAVLVLGAVHLRMFKKKLDEPPSTLTPIA